MTSEQQKSRVLKAVTEASATWQAAFNSGNAAGCAAQYEPSATMQAMPFGQFTGCAEIQAFWQRLIDGGFAEVSYIEPNIDVIDDTQAVLTAQWTMNNAHGVIHKELWVMQVDGRAKLREDCFEAQSE